MKHLFTLVILGLMLGMTSCLEIIDDLSLNEDGTGSFKYTVNLSSSKVKINSYLALDSLDGREVPSMEEITRQLDEVVTLLTGKEGISNVRFDSDYDNFIFKLNLDFASIAELESAIKTIVKEKNTGQRIEELDREWLSYSGSSLNRSIPQLHFQRSQRLKPDEIAKLKKGTYTSITRFDREVERFENASALLAKNKKAVMVRTDPYSLIQRTDLLDNAIYLHPSADNK
ncbi:MAG: hypothetical protein ACI865_001290 [Flavobacteriaceae bacterium]|jgi:hypothetical protein